MQDGRVLTPHFSTYLLPTTLDMPVEITPVLLELADPHGPFGARGRGRDAAGAAHPGHRRRHPRCHRSLAHRPAHDPRARVDGADRPGRCARPRPMNPQPATIGPRCGCWAASNIAPACSGAGRCGCCSPRSPDGFGGDPGAQAAAGLLLMALIAGEAWWAHIPSPQHPTREFVIDFLSSAAIAGFGMAVVLAILLWVPHR